MSLVGTSCVAQCRVRPHGGANAISRPGGAVTLRPPLLSSQADNRRRHAVAALARETPLRLHKALGAGGKNHAITTTLLPRLHPVRPNAAARPPHRFPLLLHAGRRDAAQLPAGPEAPQVSLPLAGFLACLAYGFLMFSCVCLLVRWGSRRMGFEKEDAYFWKQMGKAMLCTYTLFGVAWLWNETSPLGWWTLKPRPKVCPVSPFRSCTFNCQYVRLFSWNRYSYAPTLYFCCNISKGYCVLHSPHLILHTRANSHCPNG